MTDKELLLEKYFRRIAENLDISPTMREKAEKSYCAVGEWLGDCGVDSDVKIMPQGSFYLALLYAQCQMQMNTILIWFAC